MKKMAICLLLAISLTGVSFMTGMSTATGFAASDIMAEAASEYTVTFDCAGGTYNSSASFSQSVISGGLATEPNESLMVRHNCSFDGWVTSAGKEWNFSEDTVNQNLTLYAKWNWNDSRKIEEWGSGTTGIQNYFEDKYYTYAQRVSDIVGRSGGHI